MHTEIKVLLKLEWTYNLKQIIPELHSLLTYGLSDTENYFSGSQNSIAASVYIIREKKSKRGRAGEGDACPKFSECSITNKELLET